MTDDGRRPDKYDAFILLRVKVEKPVRRSILLVQGVLFCGLTTLGLVVLVWHVNDL